VHIQKKYVKTHGHIQGQIYEGNQTILRIKDCKKKDNTIDKLQQMKRAIKQSKEQIE
jgi:hypothetical protein